jgi:hypothetical protein
MRSDPTDVDTSSISPLRPHVMARFGAHLRRESDLPNRPRPREGSGAQILTFRFANGLFENRIPVYERTGAYRDRHAQGRRRAHHFGMHGPDHLGDTRAESRRWVRRSCLRNTDAAVDRRFTVSRRVDRAACRIACHRLPSSWWRCSD